MKKNKNTKKEETGKKEFSSTSSVFEKVNSGLEALMKSLPDHIKPGSDFKANLDSYQTILRCRATAYLDADHWEEVDQELTKQIEAVRAEIIDLKGKSNRQAKSLVKIEKEEYIEDPNTTEMNILVAKVDKKEKRLAAVQEEIANLERENEEVQNDLNNGTAPKPPVTAIREKRSQISGIQQESAQIEKDWNTTQRENNIKVTKITQNIQTLENENNLLEMQINSLVSRIDLMTQAAKVPKKSYSQRQKELEELDKKFTEEEDEPQQTEQPVKKYHFAPRAPREQIVLKNNPKLPKEQNEQDQNNKFKSPRRKDINTKGDDKIQVNKPKSGVTKYSDKPNNGSKQPRVSNSNKGKEPESLYNNNQKGPKGKANALQDSIPNQDKKLKNGKQNDIKNPTNPKQEFSSPRTKNVAAKPKDNQENNNIKPNKKDPTNPKLNENDNDKTTGKTNKPTANKETNKGPQSQNTKKAKVEETKNNQSNPALPGQAGKKVTKIGDSEQEKATIAKKKINHNDDKQNEEIGVNKKVSGKTNGTAEDAKADNKATQNKKAKKAQDGEIKEDDPSKPILSGKAGKKSTKTDDKEPEKAIISNKKGSHNDDQHNVETEISKDPLKKKNNRKGHAEIHEPESENHSPKVGPRSIKKQKSPNNSNVRFVGHIGKFIDPTDTTTFPPINNADIKRVMTPLTHKDIEPRRIPFVNGFEMIFYDIAERVPNFPVSA